MALGGNLMYSISPTNKHGKYRYEVTYALKQSMTAAELIFTKLMLAQQLFENNCYTNATKTQQPIQLMVLGDRQMDGRTLSPHKLFLFTV
jgi:hypothetical protein